MASLNRKVFSTSEIFMRKEGEGRGMESGREGERERVSEWRGEGRGGERGEAREEREERGKYLVQTVHANRQSACLWRAGPSLVLVLVVSGKSIKEEGRNGREKRDNRLVLQGYHFNYLFVFVMCHFLVL